MRHRRPTRLLASAAVTVAACVVASCSAGATSSSSPGDAGSGATGSSPTQTGSPVRFDSPEYGYTVTLPAGWLVNQAHAKWDGQTQLSPDSFEADVFIGPSSKLSFAAAAGWTHALAAYARYLIATTVRYHSDTCPRKPNRQEAIAIGGSPGVLLEYNCGILINIAGTVRHRIGYEFVFRDETVQAATDRSDRAVFTQILRSVEFPR